jgi:uncharacterized protein (TIGR00255 family)
MTGYGAAERETAAGRLRVEIKTVNHDTFRVSMRLPGALEAHETQIREWLRGELPRGHLNYTLRLETPEGEQAERVTLTVDETRVDEYLRAFAELKERFQLPGTIDLAAIGRYNDIFVRAVAEPPEIAVDDLREVTLAAAAATAAMRAEEGRRLAADLEERLAAIEAALLVVAERAPARLTAERDRLRAAIAELAGEVATDEDRLAREIAYLAERWDISEELVRLRSHIDFFRDMMRQEGHEPVGKRLRFISQEMLREANTIGSKANDVGIQHQVVAIKNEIERLREQVENVE